CQGKWVAGAMGISLVSHVGFVLTFYFCAQVFQEPNPATPNPSLSAHFLIVPIGMMIQAFVPTPGGVGASELGYSSMCSMLGRAGAAGALGMLTLRLIQAGLGLIGYLVYLRMKPALRAEAPPTPPGNGLALKPALATATATVSATD